MKKLVGVVGLVLVLIGLGAGVAWGYRCQDKRECVSASTARRVAPFDFARLMMATAPAPAVESTPAVSAPSTPEADAPADAPAPTPPCELDWSLPVNWPNTQALLSCYKLLYPWDETTHTYPGATEHPLCPPAGSPWEAVFNNSVCWAINHGTPAAMTATAIGPITVTPSATQPVLETPTTQPYP